MATVLFVSEKYPPDIGGVAASAGRITAALVRLGHDLHVVTLTRELPAGRVEPAELRDRLTVYRVGQSKNLDFTLQQALAFLEWLHSRRRFDLCWGHYVATAGFLAALFGRTVGVPSLLSVRGNDFDRQVFPPGDMARLMWCLQKADHLVAVSADLARRVSVLVDRSPTVLPNAIDTGVFRPGPRDPALAARYNPGGGLLVGFSGELRAKKGLNFLLAALAEVRRQRPAKLLVIGEVRGGDQGEFERARVGLGLDDAVAVTGHLADPAAVAARLRLLDAFALPSLWDGMPNGLLEAMACGCPVVASDAGGIPEVVADGVSGLLVPRTHLHNFGHRLTELLTLPEAERDRMRAAALDTIAHRHSPEVEERNLAGLLAAVAKSAS